MTTKMINKVFSVSRPPAGGEESEAETPMSVTPHLTPSLTPSSTLQGSKFFPPDFNPDSFKGGECGLKIKCC